MRLIDADALNFDCLKHEPYPDLTAKTIVDDAPTIDAVPVVRCWECRHWRPDEDEGHCDNPDGLDNYALPTDFCSYGERNGGEG